LIYWWERGEVSILARHVNGKAIKIQKVITHSKPSTYEKRTPKGSAKHKPLKMNNLWTRKTPFRPPQPKRGEHLSSIHHVHLRKSFRLHHT
jgi:hypothetical protein